MGRKEVDYTVNLLTSNVMRDACSAYLVLVEASEKSPEIYEYMDRFIELSEGGNSLTRSRGLGLVAANARWDDEGKVEKALPRLLAHITDEKPITARQFIKQLPQITSAKPELRETVLSALNDADFSAYADSMSPLLEKDRAAAIIAIG